MHTISNFGVWLGDTIEIEFRWLRDIIPMHVEMLKLNLQIVWADVKIFLYS
jgi:hypothetical protein